MRWVFYSLLILNVVYLVAGLVNMSAPDPEGRSGADSVASSAPQRLQLLSEAGGAAANGNKNASYRQRLCPALGPWQARPRALDALTELENSGYQGTVRPLRVEEEKLNWVYLPAYSSRDEALKVLRELQSRGVDSFIVSEGDDQNAISLGYFSSEESAEGLKVKMNNAGYPAEVRPMARTVTEYWVYLEPRSITDDGKLLRRYLAEHPDLKADHTACKPAAPAPDLDPESAGEAVSGADAAAEPADGTENAGADDAPASESPASAEENAAG